jgi:hypothetical protein
MPSPMVPMVTSPTPRYLALPHGTIHYAQAPCPPLPPWMGPCTTTRPLVLPGGTIPYLVVVCPTWGEASPLSPPPCGKEGGRPYKEGRIGQ